MSYINLSYRDMFRKEAEFPAIPKLPSNKDVGMYIRFYTLLIFTIIIGVGFLVWIVGSVIENRDQAINTCMGNGYTADYCKSALR